MKKGKGIELAVPAEQSRLEPFATILTDVVIPFATRSTWLDSASKPPAKELQRISRRIDLQLKIHWKQQSHPAIWVHALLVCVHFFHQAAIAQANRQTRQQGGQMEAIDAAYSLLQHLTLHHGLYDLYLRIS